MLAGVALIIEEVGCVLVVVEIDADQRERWEDKLTIDTHRVEH